MFVWSNKKISREKFFQTKVNIPDPQIPTTHSEKFKAKK
jgi:hypothetical protein